MTALPVSGNDIQDDMAGTIQVGQVVKRFGDHEAVKGITFNVRSGEILGLLGPNGAGKSTLIRMMTALTPITEGQVFIDGHNVSSEAGVVRKSIGVLPQALTSDLDLTVEENLSIYAKLYGVDRAQRLKNIGDLLDAVELTPRRNDMVKTLSGGMRRRLEIARGLVHNPKVFFLDEPTTGLDPVSRVRVWELLKNLNGTHGITMVVTTHYMDEADFLCDRIAIVDHGALIRLDTPENLKKCVPDGTLIEATFKTVPAGWVERMATLSGDRELERPEENVIRFRAENGSRAITELVSLAVREGVELTSIAVKPTTLDDVFVHFTGHVIQDKINRPMGGRRKGNA